MASADASDIETWHNSNVEMDARLPDLPKHGEAINPSMEYDGPYKEFFGNPPR